MAFQYGVYAERDSVKRAKKDLDAAASPGAYAPDAETAAAAGEALAAIAARQPFTYDLNGDALYRQYRAHYLEAGRRAAADAAGRAAAMTGGYGSSYAETAGAEAYARELEGLNDVLPELYRLAYDRYQREGEEQRALYGLYADREARDYDRWRDRNDDYRADRNYYAGRLDAERSFDYGLWRDEEARRYQNASLAAAEAAAYAGGGSGGAGGSGGGRRVYNGGKTQAGDGGDGVDRDSEAYEKDRILREYLRDGDAKFPQGLTPLGAGSRSGAVIAKDRATGRNYELWVGPDGTVLSKKK